VLWALVLVVVFVVAVFSFVVVAEFLAALDAMSHSVSIDVVVFILFASGYINLFKVLFVLSLLFKRQKQHICTSTNQPKR